MSGPAGPEDGHGYWRSLEELHRGRDETGSGGWSEFPEGADEPPPELSRRRFVEIMGASAALAGLGGCVDSPAERILPYAERPPEVTPGEPLHYATAMVLDGYATGLVARSREGRPVKIEGNPDHPASLGAAGTFEQASLLRLYDPHRAEEVRRNGEPRSWSELVRAWERPDEEDPDGDGLHLLLEPTSSPFRAALLERIRERRPGASVHYHAPARSREPLRAARTSFGEPLEPRYELAEVDVLVVLDADLLSSGPAHLRHARDFADTRGTRAPGDRMSRLYVAEPAPTPTSAQADHRLRVRSGEIPALAAAIARELGAGSLLEGMPDGWTAGEPDGRVRRWVESAAADLRDRPGRGLLVAGPEQPAGVHALTHHVNALLGNSGRAVRWGRSPIFEAERAGGGAVGLAEAIAAGDVRRLVVAGGDPVHTAPGELELGRRIGEVPRSLHLGYYRNRTAEACEWFAPEAHFLEAWGDARAFDGTLGAIQPLIAPLTGGRTVDEVLAVLAGEGRTGVHELLRRRWRTAVHPGGEEASDAEFEAFWEEALRAGLVEGSAAPAGARTPDRSGLPELLSELEPLPPEAVEARFRPDPKVHDGRFADNPWLQELPHPVTKLTWDNAAMLSPATAADLDVEEGEWLEVTLGDRSLRIPALPVPGHADGSLTLPLGYGKTSGQPVAEGVGVDVYPIRPTDRPHLAAGGVRPARDGDGDRPPRTSFARTQRHWELDGRPIVLENTLDGYREDPDFTEEHRGEVASLYEPPHQEADHQWGMTIDLSRCIGCSACMVACRSENNIPVVGREGVRRSREMNWIRIDRYHRGDPADPDAVHQPMLCQHCEKAPCEYVCPVNATVHSADGLNEMIYNRCIGTRFCSNNCPYKVRRFNWFDYDDRRRDRERLALNPDVTVRDRGVMEKCTYCVQRIRRAEIAARREGRELGGDEVTTACQQACPTRAIVFGDLADPDSSVSRTRERDRRFSVLHELGTRPRTQYLARITNPRDRSDG